MWLPDQPLRNLQRKSEQLDLESFSNARGDLPDRIGVVRYLLPLAWSTRESWDYYREFLVYRCMFSTQQCGRQRAVYLLHVCSATTAVESEMFCLATRYARRTLVS